MQRKCLLLTQSGHSDRAVIVKVQLGKLMQYFEASDGKLERIGKVIGDAIAAFFILSVIVLALSFVFR